MKKELCELSVEKRRKEFQKIKKKVLKRFPHACTHITPNNRYLVSDGEDGIVGEEYMLPPAKTVWQAWEYALQYGVRLHQNLMRTHPLRLSGDQVEAKIMRINRRRGNRYKE